MQAWVKTMTGRENFSVQKLFDQLILIYDNFQSMEIAAKKLYKKKQKINNRFQRSFRVSKKKLLKTKGMDFNDQITKTFFNNVLNNEMHKTLTSFFIPAFYIAYCTMFHGMNNQFEILRSKIGTTTTTVIKITKNFIMINSTTNDEMD